MRASYDIYIRVDVLRSLPITIRPGPKPRPITYGYTKVINNNKIIEKINLFMVM